MPSYIPPGYFPGTPSTPTPPAPTPVATGSYFGFSYFGPYMGLGYWGGRLLVIPELPSINDGHVYDDIVARLNATNLFDENGVIFGPAPENDRATADMAAVAVVTPTSPGRQVADGVMGRTYREVRYRLTVVARAEEKADGYRAALRLARAAHNALNRKRLAGACLPWKTILAGESDVVDQHPNFLVRLDGVFGYAFNVTDGLPDVAD